MNAVNYRVSISQPCDLSVVFKDTRWGSNDAPYDRSFELNNTVLFQIRDALKEQL